MKLSGPGQETPPPELCSSCFQQRGELFHVDFESAWDGPRFEPGVMGENGQVSSGIPVAIDDLVICEECLRTAVGLLPQDEGEEDLEAVLRERVRELEGDAEKREAYVEKLEAAMSARRERDDSKKRLLARAGR